MKTPRFAIVGVGLLAAATFALTGCGSTSSGTTTTSSTGPSTTIDAKAALTKAVSTLATNGYDIKVTAGPLTGTGSIDPGKGLGLEEKGTVQGVAVDLNVVAIGTDFYAKIDVGPLGNTLGLHSQQWYKVDTSKIDTSSLPVNLSSSDLLGVAGLLTSVTDVTATDSTHITGTVDLSAAKSALLAQSDMASAAADVKAVPFTVTLDDQGRISELKVEGTGDVSVDVQFSNYGSPTAVTAPSGAIDAPQAIYQVLGNS